LTFRRARPIGAMKTTPALRISLGPFAIGGGADLLPRGWQTAALVARGCRQRMRSRAVGDQYRAHAILTDATLVDT